MVSLLLRYTKWNKYSFAALIGALEVDTRLKNLKVSFLTNVFQDIEQVLDEEGFCIVAYSILSTQFLNVKEEVKKIREKFKDSVFLVAGGPHVTARPKQVLYKISEGEDWRNIPGIAFLESPNKLQLNLPEKIVNLNDYPPFSPKYGLFSPIEISRGCPFGCKMCQTSRIFGFKMRHRSIECIVKWVKIAVKRGYDKMWFISPNSFAYGSSSGRKPEPEKIEKLLKSISEVEGLKGIYFGTFPSVIVGAQSGSQRILNIINRGHTVEDVFLAVDNLIDYGFVPDIDLIFGFPFENDEDRKLTLDMIKYLISKGCRIHAHIFMPLPGTPFENYPPGKIDSKTKKVLGDLARRGLLYGSWAVQEKLAIMLSKL
ncbi:MAG: B12-binding domain-containing radical SAM protein [Thermofilum sp. ex4484_82]|nr:MAG: B12-binding domain-containing radical SAM protein [Thermofilum sp. ex4484_82]OYT36629.1 MAG: B12-binding domain-containing radical SAM protein [Archaeoglobales archaeon ex4484_92]